MCLDVVKQAIIILLIDPAALIAKQRLVVRSSTKGLKKREKQI
jgi:hypothetical protein